nr:HlyD family efflux transporter periplasmic adaptor subunit [Bacteroidota bacterium]
MPLNQINIRTEEIDEILGKTPNKIIRWGVSVILVVVVVLLTGSWFFKYPDFINSTIEITTPNPPADVVAKATGKIDSIYVENNELVKTNRILAIIENPADYSDIKLLNSWLDSLGQNFIHKDSIHVSGFFLQKEMVLGELQSNFSFFISAYNNMSNYFQMGYYTKKIEAIKKQVQDYRIYYNYTYDQKSTMKSDLLLSEKDYQRFQKLFDSKTIPEAELEQAQSRYLNKKAAFESIRNSLANINIQISQLENNMLDLRLQDWQQKEKQLISLYEAYNNLNAQLDMWEQRYVLKAPESGRCIFTEYWSRNQNITIGEKLMTIIPHETGDIVGKLLLPVIGAGKVKKGQVVNIKLHNYPYMEFGMLHGVVHSISSIPSEDFYYVEVGFPDGMKTSYGIEITFSQQMQGTAEIITDDVRLLHRILQPLKSVLTERTKY